MHISELKQLITVEKVKITVKYPLQQPPHVAWFSLAFQDSLSEIREAFNIFDKDGNGYITASELRHFLSSLGYNMTEAELMDMMNKIGNGKLWRSCHSPPLSRDQPLTAVFTNINTQSKLDISSFHSTDADGNGAVDFPELLELTTKKLHVLSEEELAQQTFNVFDRTHKGHITMNDLRHMFVTLEQTFSDPELQDMLLQADFDQDGKVNFKDFLKMMNAETSKK
jgi:calmodulin